MRECSSYFPVRITRPSVQVYFLQKTPLFPCFVFCNVICSMCRLSVFAVFLDVVLLFQCYVVPPVFFCFAVLRLFMCSAISRTSSSSSTSIFFFFGIKYRYNIMTTPVEVKMKNLSLTFLTTWQVVTYKTK